MLLNLLRVLLVFAFLRFAVRLFVWLARSSSEAPPPAIEARRRERPRIVDVPFTEESPVGKGRR